jgi:hypothetical protein
VSKKLIFLSLTVAIGAIYSPAVATDLLAQKESNCRGNKQAPKSYPQENEKYFKPGNRDRSKAATSDMEPYLHLREVEQMQRAQEAEWNFVLNCGFDPLSREAIVHFYKIGTKVSKNRWPQNEADRAFIKEQILRIKEQRWLKIIEEGKERVSKEVVVYFYEKGKEVPKHQWPCSAEDTKFIQEKMQGIKERRRWIKVLEGGKDELPKEAVVYFYENGKDVPLLQWPRRVADIDFIKEKLQRIKERGWLKDLKRGIDQLPKEAIVYFYNEGKKVPSHQWPRSEEDKAFFKAEGIEFPQLPKKTVPQDVAADPCSNNDLRLFLSIHPCDASDLADGIDVSNSSTGYFGNALPDESLIELHNLQVPVPNNSPLDNQIILHTNEKYIVDQSFEGMWQKIDQSWAIPPHS